MNLLSLFSNSKLRAAWSYSTTGHLWRVLFGETGHVVGEVRDNEKKTVSFFCLKEHLGTVLWENKTMHEQWWIGIEALHQGTILLHGFEKPDVPEHRRIIALDLETGVQRWVNEDLAYWFAYQDKVYAHQTLFEKRVGYALALDTGEILETYDQGIEQLFALRQLARQEDQSSLFRFPLVFEGKDTTKAESLMLRDIRRKPVAGNVEYLQKDDFLLYNYHVRTSEKEHENRFVILDVRRGRELFSEVLARKAPAPAPDSFFLKESTVYFVKDQHTLVSLPLPDQLQGGA